MSVVSRWILGAPKTREQIEELYVDIAAPTLVGLAMGDSRGAIEARLGAPRSWLKARKGNLDYGHLGLDLRLGEGGLAGFYVHAISEPGDPWEPFAGSWRPGDLRQAPNLRAFLETLGEPKRRDLDDDFISLFWERRALVNADFSANGELQALWVDFDDSL